MPLVVLDPIVLVNTAKAPLRSSAKLLTLLAYGRVSAYLARGGAADFAAMADMGDTSENGIVKAETDARAMHAVLKAAIPPGPTGAPPDDWRMAVSRELCGRVLKRVGDLRDAHGVELDGGMVWGSIISHASESLWETWSVDAIPDYTGVKDIDGNISIHTALRVGASILITKNSAVCENPAVPMTYSYSGPVQQAQPEPLIAANLDWITEALVRAGFDLEQVDPTALERVAPAGSAAPRPWPPRRRPPGRVTAKLFPHRNE